MPSFLPAECEQNAVGARLSEVRHTCHLRWKQPAVPQGAATSSSPASCLEVPATRLLKAGGVGEGGDILPVATSLLLLC